MCFIFTGFKLCVSNKHITIATLDCHLLKDPDRIIERYNKSTLDEDVYHQLVNCGDNGAIQRIDFMPAGDDQGVVTRVDFGCIKIRVDDSIENTVPGPSAVA